MGDVAGIILKQVLPPKSEFSVSNWTYIFKLLGLIVVADGKVVKEKVDAYQDAMIELAVVIDPKIVMTRKMAFSGFSK